MAWRHLDTCRGPRGEPGEGDPPGSAEGGNWPAKQANEPAEGAAGGAGRRGAWTRRLQPAHAALGRRPAERPARGRAKLGDAEPGPGRGRPRRAPTRGLSLDAGDATAPAADWDERTRCPALRACQGHADPGRDGGPSRRQPARSRGTRWRCCSTRSPVRPARGRLIRPPGQDGAARPCLRDAGPAEVHPAVAFLSGELPQRQIGVGYASLREAPDPPTEPSLTVTEVDAAFDRIGGLSGQGSGRRRRLHGRCGGRPGSRTPDPAARRRAAPGRPRRGDGRGGRQGRRGPGAEVRRAAMLRGALAPVARPRWPTVSRGCASSASRSGGPSSRCSPRARPA